MILSAEAAKIFPFRLVFKYHVLDKFKVVLLMWFVKSFGIKDVRINMSIFSAIFILLIVIFPSSLNFNFQMVERTDLVCK
jgi:hypothetical protein